MAKSKSGGTRAYLRGKIGADVYSIGKTAKGKKQQVVRSLAEVVSNPQTAAQMRQRCLMSTVSVVAGAIGFMINHSFDRVPAGQPSISEFIARNIALMKEDIATTTDNSGNYAYKAYNTKQACPGAYIISDGDAPANWTFPTGYTYQGFMVNAFGKTLQDLADNMLLRKGDYITSLVIGGLMPAQPVDIHYFRISIKDDCDLTLPITQANVEAMFDVESSDEVDFYVSRGGDNHPEEMLVMISMPNGAALAGGAILSQQYDGGYRHSFCRMKTANVDDRYSSWLSFDQAIETYPVGTERFLNGGDI